MRDLSRLIESVAAPAVQIVRSRASTRSHLGGAPHLPLDTPWPEKAGRRLDFLARVSLPEVHAALAIPWLPKDGALLFFYDARSQPWGFRPSDIGSWAVLHVPDRPAEDAGSGGEGTLPHRSVAMQPIVAPPSLDRPCVKAFELTDPEADAYDEMLRSVHGGKPRHQLGGYPWTVHNDEMELECQLAINGLFVGDDSGFDDARAEILREGAADWRLLLQLDSDRDLGVMWGDAGVIYFWVREPDAMRAHFDDVWVLLQCC